MKINTFILKNIQKAILSEKLSKTSKIVKLVEISENPNNNISPKKKFWINTLLRLVADESYYKDVKITNVKWDDVFKLYNDEYTPQEAAAMLIQMDESIESKYKNRLNEENANMSKPIDISFDLKKLNTKEYTDFEFSDLIDSINSTRGLSKNIEKRSDGTYGFVDLVHKNSKDESLRIPIMLLTPDASKRLSKDGSNFKASKWDKLISSNIFNTKKDAEDARSNAILKRKDIAPYIHNDTIKSISVYDEDGNLMNGEILDANGTPYNLDRLRSLITKRPDTLLSFNEKSEHSTGGTEKVFNLGLPALTGLIVDESDSKKSFHIVNTCPMAGSCKAHCFAMKGGYVQFESPALKMVQKLNFLMNDPKGFQAKLVNEIKSEYNKMKSDFKDSTWHLLVRFHDSGDFFSDDYSNLALNVCRIFREGIYKENPVLFYAYTKQLDAKGKLEKEPNFVINFSLGSKEGSKIDTKTTKLAAVVDDLNLNKITPDLKNKIVSFLKNNSKTSKYDIYNYLKNVAKLPDSDRTFKVTTLLNMIKTQDAKNLRKLYEREVVNVKDTAWLKYVKRVKTGNLIKQYEKKGGKKVRDSQGNYISNMVDEYKWEFISDRAWKLFQDRLYNTYKDKFGITRDSIIKYSDWVELPRSEWSGKENVGVWNVVILPGIDGDLAASRSDVHISFLLVH